MQTIKNPRFAARGDFPLARDRLVAAASEFDRLAGMGGVAGSQGANSRLTSGCGRPD